ncbi:hypothetical protein GYH30_029307 [Glycine max]|nr:hypothetical protein GYH30_029307 [Glycine max]
MKCCVVLPNSCMHYHIISHYLVSSFYELEHSRLSDSAVDAVKNLLPEYAQNDLGNVCSWADRVRFYLHWSGPLHFADTPGNL